MTLVDPKSGVPFTFGEKLSSSDMSTIFEQQPRALDATDGGSYTLTGILTLGGSSLVTINWQNVTVGSASNWTWNGNTHYPKLSGRNLKRTQALLLVGSTTFNTTPDFVCAPIGGTWTQAYVDTGGTNDPVALFALTDIPDLCTLRFVDILIDPANTSTATEKPVCKVLRRGSTGTGQIGISVTDSTSGAGYQAEHTIRVTGISGNPIGESIDHENGFSYYLQFTGESGSGAVAGLSILSIQCEYEVTNLTP